MNWLTQASGVQAKMTGTGSSIFVAVKDEQHAQQLKTALPGQWQGFYARGVNRSSLLSRLGKHA
jgi:4-diphosphocytidyl-2-C-methyl-D-erythritol kinase